MTLAGLVEEVIMPNVWSKPRDVDVVIVAAIALQSLLGKRERTVKHDSILTGQLHYDELMNTENENRFREQVRMDKPTFEKLVKLLENHGGLKRSKGWCYLQEKRVEVCPGEKVMIFIDILGGLTNRKTQETWQHSGSTISTVVHDVAESMIACKDFFVRAPRPNDPTHERIANDPKFKEFFDCMGALDGSHVPAVVSAGLAGRFRNRKKFVSQNVLGVCDFDMLFTYVLAGWEGSAHDGRVLQDAVNKGLRLFTGKYYLGDAGYALSRYVLTPYRGVRYHLKEWARGNLRPQNKEELFNLRHASLRNIIERIYGVVKRRFPILSKMSPYPYPCQVDLVRCAFMLHNWIRKNQNYDDCFDAEPDVDVRVAEPNPAGNDRCVSGNQSVEEKRRLNQWRDGIAQRMWDDYQSYLANRDV